MQYCKKCGTKISTYDKFCKECGEPNYDRKEKKELSLKNLAVLFCILCVIDLIFVSCFYDKHNLLNNIKNRINKTFSHKNSEDNEDFSSKDNIVNDFSHKSHKVNQEIFFKNYMKETQIKIKNK